MPFLKEIIGETYQPLPKDEQRFVAKHVISLFKNMYADPEYDKLFKGTSVKPVNREKERHGYSSGHDEKMYENFVLETKFYNHVRQDLLSDASRYVTKNGLGKEGISMGHVAHAMARTAHEFGIHPMYVPAALSSSRKTGSFIEPKSDREERVSARDIKKAFVNHLKTKKEFNVKANRDQYPKSLHDSFIEYSTDQLWENCGHSESHWDAVKHVANKHDVPKELVAGALLANLFGMSPENDHATTVFRRDFNNYLEDKKAGIHEQHSNGQYDNEIHGELEETKRTEETSGQDRRPDDYSGTTGGSLYSHDGNGEKGIEEGELNENRVFHIQFKEGERAYFIPKGTLKNGRTTGLAFDSGAAGRSRKKPTKQSTDLTRDWKPTPQNEIPDHVKKHLNEEEITESAPPGERAEKWIKANKARFINEYGEKKGKEVLYAKAWKLFGEVTIAEGLKLIKPVYEKGHLRAEVHKDSEWDEYRVKHFTKGRHLKAADYHTDDEKDAHNTAKLWIKSGGK